MKTKIKHCETRLEPVLKDHPEELEGMLTFMQTVRELSDKFELCDKYRLIFKQAFLAGLKKACETSYVNLEKVCQFCHYYARPLSLENQAELTNCDLNFITAEDVVLENQYDDVKDNDYERLLRNILQEIPSECPYKLEMKVLLDK